jgi:hypothetical protein
MKKFQLVFYSMFIIVSLYVCLYSFSLGIWDKSGPGAGFIPLLIGLLLFISLIGIIIESGLFKKYDSKKPFWVMPGAWRPTFVLLTGTILMAALFEKAGYLLAIIPTLFIISVFTEKTSIVKNLIVPVIALAFSFLFSYLLGVKLPKGLMGF